MTLQSRNLAVAAVMFSLAAGAALVALAQQPAAPPREPTSRPAAEPTSDAKAKAEILNSARWRRAMFEMNEWLMSQKLYDQKQVDQIKADFSAKVRGMSAQDLQFMLDDMEAKFQILNSQEAQDARAWLGHYLSILSDKKREEVISKLPNFANMTAAQLEQEIAAIDQRRSSMARQDEVTRQLRDTDSNPWTQGTKAAQAAYIRDHTMQRSSYNSPYRAAPGKVPFADAKIGPSMGITTGPFGGVYMSLGF